MTVPKSSFQTRSVIINFLLIIPFAAQVPSFPNPRRVGRGSGGRAGTSGPCPPTGHQEMLCQAGSFMVLVDYEPRRSPPAPTQGANRRSFSHRAIWLLVANLTLGVILLSLIRPQITEFIELKLLDLKFLYRGPVAAGPDLAIVAIDDDSLKSLGRWPWSRETFNRLLQRLKEARPKVIGLDIIFAEKATPRSPSPWSASVRSVLSMARSRPNFCRGCRRNKRPPTWTVSWPRPSARAAPRCWAFISSRWGPRS